MLQNIGNFTDEFGTATGLDDIKYVYDFYIDNESDFAIPFYLCFILTTLYVVIFIIGILGNLLVIIVIIKDVKLRTLAHFYFISLSAADLMIILFCLPVAVYELYSSGNWIFGNAICKYILNIYKNVLDKYFLESVSSLWESCRVQVPVSNNDY